MALLHYAPIKATRPLCVCALCFNWIYRNEWRKFTVKRLKNVSFLSPHNYVPRVCVESWCAEYESCWSGLRLGITDITTVNNGKGAQEQRHSDVTQRLPRVWLWSRWRGKIKRGHRYLIGPYIFQPGNKDKQSNREIICLIWLFI